MRGARTRRRRNPRFAALCLLLIFAAVGAAVWLWAGRGLPGEGVEVPDAETIELPDELLAHVQQDTGCAIRRYQISFTGVCPNCLQKH